MAKSVMNARQWQHGERKTKRRRRRGRWWRRRRRRRWSKICRHTLNRLAGGLNLENELPPLNHPAAHSHPLHSIWFNAIPMNSFQSHLNWVDFSVIQRRWNWFSDGWWMLDGFRMDAIIIQGLFQSGVNFWKWFWRDIQVTICTESVDCYWILILRKLERISKNCDWFIYKRPVISCFLALFHHLILRFLFLSGNSLLLLNSRGAVRYVP